MTKESSGDRVNELPALVFKTRRRRNEEEEEKELKLAVTYTPEKPTNYN